MAKKLKSWLSDIFKKKEKPCDKIEGQFPTDRSEESLFRVGRNLHYHRSSERLVAARNDFYQTQKEFRDSWTGNDVGLDSLHWESTRCYKGDASIDRLPPISNASHNCGPTSSSTRVAKSSIPCYTEDLSTPGSSADKMEECCISDPLGASTQDAAKKSATTTGIKQGTVTTSAQVNNVDVKTMRQVEIAKPAKPTQLKQGTVANSAIIAALTAESAAPKSTPGNQPNHRTVPNSAIIAALTLGTAAKSATETQTKDETVTKSATETQTEDETVKMSATETQTKDETVKKSDARASLAQVAATSAQTNHEIVTDSVKIVPSTQCTTLKPETSTQTMPETVTKTVASSKMASSTQSAVIATTSAKQEKRAVTSSVQLASSMQATAKMTTKSTQPKHETMTDSNQKAIQKKIWATPNAGNSTQSKQEKVTSSIQKASSTQSKAQTSATLAQPEQGPKTNSNLKAASTKSSNPKPVTSTQSKQGAMPNLAATDTLEQSTASKSGTLTQPKQGAARNSITMTSTTQCIVSKLPQPKQTVGQKTLVHTKDIAPGTSDPSNHLTKSGSQFDTLQKNGKQHFPKDTSKKVKSGFTRLYSFARILSINDKYGYAETGEKFPRTFYFDTSSDWYTCTDETFSQKYPVDSNIFIVVDHRRQQVINVAIVAATELTQLVRVGKVTHTHKAENQGQSKTTAIVAFTTDCGEHHRAILTCASFHREHHEYHSEPSCRTEKSCDAYMYENDMQLHTGDLLKFLAVPIPPIGKDNDDVYADIWTKELDGITFFIYWYYEIDAYQFAQGLGVPPGTYQGINTRSNSGT